MNVTTQDWKKSGDEVRKILDAQKNDKETWMGEIKALRFKWQISKDAASFTTWKNNKRDRRGILFPILKLMVKVLYPFVKKAEKNDY